MTKKKTKAINYYVVPNAAAGGEWGLKEEGSDIPISLHETQEEAYQAGVALAQGRGRVMVHQLDGTFSDMSS